MNSYLFDIGGRARKISRFVGRVRGELQRALVEEKKLRKLSQQDIAHNIGVNRSVINRQLMGTENLTIRRVAELAWAMGWDIEFKMNRMSNFLHKPGLHEPIKGDVLTYQNPTREVPSWEGEELMNVVRLLQARQQPLIREFTSATNDNFGSRLVEVAA